MYNYFEIKHIKLQLNPIVLRGWDPFSSEISFTH